MNQQAIDRVKERLSKYLKRTDDSDKSYDNWYCKALEHTLEDLQALWDGWIPVTEWIPNETILFKWIFEWKEFTWTWILDTDRFIDELWEIVVYSEYVTHWMHLKLPPNK